MVDRFGRGPTFGTLQRLLRDIGFTKAVSSQGHVMNRHEESGCALFYPIIPNGNEIPTLHVALTRLCLENFGVMRAEDFDEELRRYFTNG